MTAIRLSVLVRLAREAVRPGAPTLAPSFAPFNRWRLPRFLGAGSSWGVKSGKAGVKSPLGAQSGLGQEASARPWRRAERGGMLGQHLVHPALLRLILAP